MKYLLSVTVAVLLTAFSAHSTGAQVSTLTNADVIRFVAMGLSGQAVTTLIKEANEAKATRFDLSPSAVSDLAGHGVSPAVIDAMRQTSATQTSMLPPGTEGETFAPKVISTQTAQASIDPTTTTLPQGFSPNDPEMVFKGLSPSVAGGRV